MLDIKFIRENLELVKTAARNKGVEADVDRLLAVDKKRRELMVELEKVRSEKNKASKEIPSLSASERQQKIVAMKEIDQKSSLLEQELSVLDSEFLTLMHQIPNLPARDVAVGKDETENQIIKKWGEIPTFDFAHKDHLSLGEALDIIDVKSAAEVSGTRFGYLKNEAVLLEFALVQLALETLIKEGFTPVIPPALIRKSITEGLGYWQVGGHDYYWVLEEKVLEEESHKGLYLVGTAEHSIVPLHKDGILRAEDLPKRYVAFSSCFRREAGSYGKDTRGILRVHQFDKVEMVSFTTAEQDDQEHEYLLSLEEKLFQLLKLPYQVVKMCTADLGFPVARKYDIEAWMPGQNAYREVTSTSTTTDFQARRLNIKYRDKAGHTDYTHILNGTAFAIGRTLIAIIENYQQEDGSVAIPEVLQKYVGMKEIRRGEQI